jgi:16S rRNA (uracil1498-N3)-methyltransferase
MPHFYVPPRLVRGGSFLLEEDESRHLVTVLRRGAGDEIGLFDGEGRVYRGRIESVDGGLVRGRVLEEAAGAAPAFRLRLFQGLPKGDKFDWILQKAAELGAAEVVPLLTERCVAKVPPEKIPGRLARWEKILRAAAKQGGRPDVPAVRAPATLAEALALRGPDDLTLIPWEGEKSLALKQALRAGLKRKPPAVNVFIGPEGGFTPAEADRARAAGAAAVTLGPWILRTETAGLFAAAALLYESLEDLG